MRRAWLACVLWSGCVATESGNPAQRCNDSRSCEADQFCYRGFCVEEEQQVDPVTAEDASIAEASAFDAGSPLPVPVAVVDAAVEDASVADAGGDAGRIAEPTDAGRDGDVRDAGGDVRDAGLPCQQECRPPQQSSSACKKCVKSAYGDEPDKLCGKPGDYDDDDDDDKALGLESICSALCLGTASVGPNCVPLLLCHGPKCGGLP